MGNTVRKQSLPSAQVLILPLIVHLVQLAYSGLYKMCATPLLTSTAGSGNLAL